METVTLPHFSAFRAAGVVLDYINYILGGPNRYFGREEVISCNRQSLPGEGTKYYLVLTIRDGLNEQPILNCTATVLYYTSKKAPDVTYTLQPEPQNYTAEKDKEFYTKMKSRSEPLVAENIPGN
ncbi:hypothetical protein GDO78_001807 [Eleutherodactylus coqui]|uniref:Cystatin LXN-type domain-containing protein n=1 Tax=Eleutherodactylus coqui TaxID=57060 RepID=A0A8J6FWJ8_ELECQ|nr:hypothetical protein GDO78_001807 [Eleutherodactylus coqui]